jgi:hypothetical protein
MEHEASKAISLVSNPSFSKVSIKICCAAFSGGTIIVDDTKALTSGGVEKCGRKKKWEVIANSAFSRYLPVQATGLPRSPLKKLCIKISDTQFAFYCNCFLLYILCFKLPRYSSAQFYKDWRYAIEKDFTDPHGEQVKYTPDGLRTWGSERYKLPFSKVPNAVSVNCDCSLIAVALEDDIYISGACDQHHWMHDTTWKGMIGAL